MMTTDLAERRRVVQRNVDQLRAPERALVAAETELASLDAQIAAQEAAQAHQQTIARLAEIAAEGSAALQAVEDARQAFDVALPPLLEAYSAARQRQHEARQVFYRALRGSDAPALIEELEVAGADLQGVLTNLSEHRDKPLDRPYSASGAFLGVLDVAMRAEAARRLGHPLAPDAVIIALPDERNNP